jgi:hypothetical protein
LGALDETAPALAEHTVLNDLRGTGKFENLNRLLAQVSLDQTRWVLAVDDDVASLQAPAAAPKPLPPLHDFQAFSRLMGFDWVADFDRAHARPAEEGTA